jgi:hypothetical protein
MHNRLSIMEKLPVPGLLGGIIPAAPPPPPVTRLR